MNYEPRTAEFDSKMAWQNEMDAAPSKRKGLWIILALLLIAAALAGAWFMMNSGKNDAAKKDAAPAGAASGKDDKQAPNVTVIVPGRQLVDNMISATGTLAARREMPVGAVGEGGLVVRVLVEAGSWVRQGQVLAIVDRQVQSLQSAQIAGQISAAQADARLAQAELDRAQALQSRGFLSKADLQRKMATRDRSLAQVRITQAQFAENRARIGRLDIKAPASGLVLARQVEPGQVVGPGSGVLFRIAQGGELEMKAKLSEADLAKVRVGLGAQVTPVGSTSSFAGRIWQISPVIDPQLRQGEARISLGYSPELRPGGFGSARISGGLVEAPLLPESAVLSDGLKNYLLLIDADNKVQRRDVKVAAVTDHGVAIAEGITGTERVVLSAGGFLNPGETVVPKMAPAKQ